MESAPPLIARQRELQRLDACLTSARSVWAAIALLRGEAGMGKSRLAESLAEQARGAGVLVATGHCTPVSGGEPPVRPVRRDPQPDRHCLRGFGTGGRHHLGPVAHGTDGVGIVAGRRPTGRGAGPVTAVHERAVGPAHHRSATAGAAALEDVHWADASSLDPLNYLARTAARND